MRSAIILTAVVVLGVLVGTTQGTIISTMWNPMTAPTINGTDADACWTAATKYPLDGLYDNFYGNAGDLNEVARVDYNYIRMGHDATNLYIYIQFNTARNITTGLNANDASVSFDWDRSTTTGYVVPPPAGGTFGIDAWITAMNPSAGLFIDKYTTQNPPGTIVHALTFGTGTRAWGQTSTRYTAVEFKIPWTVFGITTPAQLAAYKGFYWCAGESSGRGLDFYPNSGNVGAKYTTDYFMYSTDPIPEPGTLALLAAGLAGLMAYAWRRRK